MKHIHKISIGLALLLIVLVSLSRPAGLDARGFRNFNQIETKESAPPGTRAVTRLRPVNRRLVEKAVFALARAWNTNALDPMLSRDRFYDKNRLLDTLSEVAPRSAELKVLSIGGINTLEQYVKGRGGRQKQISIVSAIVRTRIEFNDARNGFVRLEGRNEFLLEIAHNAPRS